MVDGESPSLLIPHSSPSSLTLWRSRNHSTWIRVYESSLSNWAFRDDDGEDDDDDDDEDNNNCAAAAVDEDDDDDDNCAAAAVDEDDVDDEDDVYSKIVLRPRLRHLPQNLPHIHRICPGRNYQLALAPVRSRDEGDWQGQYY